MIAGGADLGLFKKEFSELTTQLDDILGREVNGQRMFGGRNVALLMATRPQRGIHPYGNDSRCLLLWEITLKLAPGMQQMKYGFSKEK